VSVAPDLIEPVVGWRAWAVCGQADGARLRSVVYDTLWRPGEALVADCRRWPSLLPKRLRPAHSPPSARCACGIYAATEPETLADYLEGFRRYQLGLFQRVFGRVRLWGSVVACEQGWRSSHAYPADLYIPVRRHARAREMAEELAPSLGDYAVPVEIVAYETQEELARTLEELRGAPSFG
jgi:hypothetical protein